MCVCVRERESESECLRCRGVCEMSQSFAVCVSRMRVFGSVCVSHVTVCVCLQVCVSQMRVSRSVCTSDTQSVCVADVTE